MSMKDLSTLCMVQYFVPIFNFSPFIFIVCLLCTFRNSTRANKSLRFWVCDIITNNGCPGVPVINSVHGLKALRTSCVPQPNAHLSSVHIHDASPKRRP